MSLVPGGILQASHQATARQQGRNKQQRQRAEIPEEKTKYRHLLVREQGASWLLCLLEGNRDWTITRENLCNTFCHLGLWQLCSKS